MFEGLVRQLMLGYLGQFIKDLQKEQLKITLWNGEVLLENVELIIEAFDYLQLPFALKHGRVGKLSIKIPWKKLGWDPMIIVLEDVFISASQREDMEWTSDAIERREFAGKKAKLAAAELAKVSRRVCDNRAGTSFISYITAKILDGIQVSIKNVHVLYRDMLNASTMAEFGVKFLGLSICRQNLVGVSGGKLRGAQVNKAVEVQGLEVHCRTIPGTIDLTNVETSTSGSKYEVRPGDGGNGDYHILSPLDVIASLVVNRSGKLDSDTPQYYISAECSNVAVSMDEVQLQQILILSDYLSVCRLRDRYGRYRPWSSPLEKKLKGWQIAWWHYTQESVLHDVQEKLKRTSWKYLGERLNSRRRYVNLYKRKLEHGRQHQEIDEDLLLELEEIEKASDIDDILLYRSTAERETQDLLIKSPVDPGSFNNLEDERPSSTLRGWLNWLSHGMLGAGGTDDSREFSGVVTDDVIKDIYEATKFHPPTSLNEDAAANEEIFLSHIKFRIFQISATLHSKRLGSAIAHLLIDRIALDCKIWDGSAVLTARINSAELSNPLNKQVILSSVKINREESKDELLQPSISAQVDVLPAFHEVRTSLKVILQPVEMTYDCRFFMGIVDFFHIIGAFKSQHERVLLSLDVIDDVQARIMSKIDYILSYRKRMVWDVSCADAIIVVPWMDENFKEHKVVLEVGMFSFQSKNKKLPVANCLHYLSDDNLNDYMSTDFINHSIFGFRLEDLYDIFEFRITDFEVRVTKPGSPELIPLFKKFSCSICLDRCIISNTRTLKDFDVKINITSLCLSFSASTYHSLLGLMSSFRNLGSTFVNTEAADANVLPHRVTTSAVLWISIRATVQCFTFEVDLESDDENSYCLVLCLEMLDASFNWNEVLDFWVSLDALKIISYLKKNRRTQYVLASCGDMSSAESLCQQQNSFICDNQSERFSIKESNRSRCLELHYETYHPELFCPKIAIFLTNFDIHCYPVIVGHVVGFVDKILNNGLPVSADGNPILDAPVSASRPQFDFTRFGYSNFVDTAESELDNIPLDHFPFVSVSKSGPSVTTENPINSEWRKVLKLRVQKIRGHESGLNKGCNYHQTWSRRMEDPFAKTLSNAQSILAEINLYSARLHFHDSSSVIGVLSLAACKSSFSQYGNCLDLLVSIEGLLLSSSWWSPTMDFPLLGPLSPYLSPILNIRARKEPNGPMELTFGVQHVSCTLYPEFLAVVIGYFSLSDWQCISSQQCTIHEKPKYDNSEENRSIIYKFEILDCILRTPAKTDCQNFLQLDIQQLVGSYLAISDKISAQRDIPPECLVPAHKFTNMNYCLNLFGRDLSLSLLLSEHHVFDSFASVEVPGYRNFSLIAPFSADVWVRFPIQSDWSNRCCFYPTCIMASIINCQLDAEGAWVLLGYEAVLNVVDLFSLVDRDSKLFSSTVSEFLQLKARLVDDTIMPIENTSFSATEIRFCVSSISMKLLSSKTKPIISEVIAEVDMQFTCTASLEDDNLSYLDISISQLSLFSLLNSVNLVESVLPYPCSSSSLVGMTFSVLDEKGNRLLLTLPCLDIWLHVFDWTEVITIVQDFYMELLKQSTISLSQDIPPSENESIDSAQNSSRYLKACSSSTPECTKDVAGHFSIKLENVGITGYLPVQFTKEVTCLIGEPLVQNKKKLQDSCDMISGNYRGFLAISLQSRLSEIVSGNRGLIMNIKFEKVEGIMLLYLGISPTTWSPMQVYNLTFESKILLQQMESTLVKVDAKQQMESTLVKVDANCDTVDLSLSKDVLALIPCLCYEAPETRPSKLFYSRIDFSIKLGLLSLGLTDGKWSSSGALFQILITNLLFHCTITESGMEGSIGADLQANYNNVDKVLWQPLVEPWNFLLSIKRKHDGISLLNGAIMTHVHLQSSGQLNLNITEPAIEIVSRSMEMIKSTQPTSGLNSVSNSLRSLDSQRSGCLEMAPYVLQNLTSLPLIYYVCNGEPSNDDLTALRSRGNFLQPGFSVPIFVAETCGKQLSPNMHGQTSDKQQASCCFLIVQLEGTSVPSTPISMDLVGLRYFEVDFSMSVNRSATGNAGEVLKGNKSVGKEVAKNGFLIPVVIDVSVQGHTKLIQLYSTVILSNVTPVPLELRFDIPFGVSPKILDPIYPGKEFPLPLHLAEAGRMRWRPLGDTYLWSEAFSITNILSEETRSSLLRSFVCYPSNPSSDPFRCCISVEERFLSTVSNVKKSSSEDEGMIYSRSCKDVLHDVETSKRCIHLVALSSPLVLRNCLPEAVSVAIENGGVTRNALLSKVETAFFHVDSSHDLTISFNIRRFRTSVLKFARAETFSGVAKFSGTKFSLSETLSFDSASADGPLFVTMEKVMDAFSGAREICVSVPFFIYNCIGFPLIVSNYVNGIERYNCTIPSCYHNDEHGYVNGGKDGLSLLFSNLRKASPDSPLKIPLNSPSVMGPDECKYSSIPLNSPDPYKVDPQYPEKYEANAGRSSMGNLKNDSTIQSDIKTDLNLADTVSVDCRTADPCMYSPTRNCSSDDIIIRLSKCPCDTTTKSIPSHLWSNPFSLVPPTGSTDSVIVPHPSLKAGYLISVCATTLLFSGRTRIVTFQPRYVISNACSRDFFYKQKGTDRAYLLIAGQHSHIQCTDTARELLFCIRFRDPGWQWSGCFSLEHLGDTQVKMQNYISGAVSMMCVEVQSADISVEHERVVRSPGNSSTNLILVSDDETGFLPYRIDNFSKEKLRIYQQRCENFETLIHSYSSHYYSWDEPCFPHRLTVEVSGERVIGSYIMDNVQQHSPVLLPATSEKPERTLRVSIHSEGAIKVLSVIDCSCHVLADLSSSDGPFMHKRKHGQKSESFAGYSERILIDIPFIGLSLMNSYPEELLFVCAKNVRIDLLQSLDQQKLSLQISFLQIDNQSHNTQHPVILSFDHEVKGNKDDKRKITNMAQSSSDGLHEPVFSLAVAKWRSKSLSLVSVEYINLRVTDFHLELEQELILSLFEFSKAVSLRLQTRASLSIDPAAFKDGLAYVPPNEFLVSDWSRSYSSCTTLYHEDCSCSSLLPSIIPIGAPWQQIHLLARKQKKIYVEHLDLAPIKFSLSFSSSPWMLRNGVLTSGESLIHRGLMALADVEGAQIHLKELVISHHLGSLESIQEILIRHYVRQFLHEIYKVFGSAGLIGNPMAFARSVSAGIRDFLSAPARNVFRSPVGLLTGVAQGTSSLLSNTVYALSDATTQFSRVAHKGIVTFALDEQTLGQTEKQQKGKSSHSKGVINEFLEGLTGLLQSPVQGAEKSGLPGVFSGIALGVTRLVAKPAASILEVTGKTAQSIKNRSKLPLVCAQSLRVRFPRPLSRDLPLRPYSWEEAVGTAVLRDADNRVNLVDEKLIVCRALREGGRFLIITQRLVLIVSCSSLVNLGKPEFQGVPADPEWLIESNIELDSIIHVTTDKNVIYIVGSSAAVFSRQNQQHQKQVTGTNSKWRKKYRAPIPLFQINLEFAEGEEAEDLVQLLLSMVSKAKEQGWSRPCLLHQISLR